MNTTPHIITSSENNSKYLVIQIRFLLERYHGSEWPPSPRKLFLALVAALYHSSGRRINKKEGENALKFLESQSPPNIHLTGQEGCRYTLFVPNNDMDVISAAYVRGVEPKDQAKLKTGKQMKPHLSNIIQYTWKINNYDVNEKHLKSLCEIVKEIPVFGYGIDPVAACGMVTESIPHIEESDVYVADDNGNDARVTIPSPGLLEDAKNHHGEFLERITGGVFAKPSPITKFYSMRYRKDSPKYDAIAFKVTNLANKNHTIQPSDAPELINKVTQIIDGTKAIKKPIAKVSTMPSIGGRYGDGMIRRIVVIVPPYVDNKTKILIKDKLNSKIIKIGGQDHQLKFISKDNDGVQRVYYKKSRAWKSVTPMDINLQKGASHEEITKAILDSLHAEGIREPVTFVNFRREPYWNNFPKLTNDHMSIYAEIEFKSPIQGPFVTGHNQVKGHGLFAASSIPDVAYFIVLGERPPITKTISIANLARRSIMSKIKNIVGEKSIPSYISGHDQYNNPLQNNHKHAFWLPVDTDLDGLIDHIAVFVQEGFGNTVRDAFYRTTCLSDGHGSNTDVRFKGFFSRDEISKKCKLFEKKSVWISTTPYFMPWHVKKTLARDDQIKKEFEIKGYKTNIPKVTNCEITINNHVVPTAIFQRRHGNQKSNGSGDAIMLEFQESIRGPIVIGYGSHFGLGMFMPAPDAQAM